MCRRSCTCKSGRPTSRRARCHAELFIIAIARYGMSGVRSVFARGPREPASTPAQAAPATDMATTWKSGEAQPTHRKQQSAARWWRTCADPFEHAWPVVEGWLIGEPTATAEELLARLATSVPDVYADKAQLRTLQWCIKAWRAEKAKDLILGQLRKAANVAAET